MPRASWCRSPEAIAGVASPLGRRLMAFMSSLAARTAHRTAQATARSRCSSLPSSSASSRRSSTTRAGMRSRRPVAGEQCADLGEAQAADDMREIHRHLAGEGRAGRASRRCSKIAEVHVEHGRDGGIDHVPELGFAHAQGGSAPALPSNRSRRFELHRASAPLPSRSVARNKYLAHCRRGGSGRG